jgi:hypothetical protein
MNADSLDKEREKLYSAIGRFIYEFSSLESGLQATIFEIIGLRGEYWYAIMSHDFSMLCTIAENVIKPRLNKGSAAKWSALLKKCRELNNHRVRIAHGNWSMGPPTRDGLVVFAARQTQKPERYYRNAGEIEALADEARHYGWELIKFSPEYKSQSK